MDQQEQQQQASGSGPLTRRGVNLGFFKGLKPICITGFAVHPDIGVGIALMVRCEGMGVPIYCTLSQGKEHFPQLVRDWMEKIDSGEIALVVNSPF